MKTTRNLIETNDICPTALREITKFSILQSLYLLSLAYVKEVLHVISNRNNHWIEAVDITLS